MTTRIARATGSERQAYGLAIFGGVLIVTILVLYAIQLTVRIEAAVASAKQSAQNLADILAEHTARTFEALDRTLQQAVIVHRDLEAGRYPSVEAASAALRHLKETSPAIIAIGWTDAAGNLEAHTYGRAPPRANLSDLPHFAAQREAAGRGLFVSWPIRSAATGRWITVISRRLDNADGSFAGIIAAPCRREKACFHIRYALVKSINELLPHKDALVSGLSVWRSQSCAGGSSESALR